MRKKLIIYISFLLQFLLWFLESSSSDESSSSSEDETRIIFDDPSTDEETHVNVSNFMETIEAFSDSDFQSHFRLRRLTAEQLIVKYALSAFFPSPSNHGGKPKIEARKEIYLFVWYISNTITFRQLGNLFGMAKSTAWAAVGRVSSWLVSVGHEYIKWPQGDVVEQTCSRFESRKRIPGVIGAIDCTHITIAAPRINKECYYDRKQNFSIVLQAVVNADKMFTDVCCGEPGSLHDSRVLRRSGLYHQVQENFTRLFPSNTFLLGDSAYAASNWIVPPYKEYGQLNDQQKNFNFIHSSTRMVVENAFGLLKGRFRRINKFTEQRNLNSVKKIIVSACVLHNLCILNADNIIINEPTPAPTEEPPPEDNIANPEPNLHGNRRERLFSQLCQMNIL
ncbi:uncharacterized protein LOC129906151 [Episyrphus balteatus]|uniref:uncharacterized protein LOC129906151 n=1 Tax=Episyrphus balteatus TaxID=286459 RepID=UPI00248534D0|nr:uncharacterized protein LOC129906151 [Episyrphus balteatus]